MEIGFRLRAVMGVDVGKDRNTRTGPRCGGGLEVGHGGEEDEIDGGGVVDDFLGSGGVDLAGGFSGG